MIAMVSSTSEPSLSAPGCNSHSRVLISVLAIWLGCAGLATAQSAPNTDIKTIGTFVLGGAAGFAMHEAGHLLFNVAFAADPGIKKVSFAGIPFFAITHDTVTPRREGVISSAGFWMQHASSELLLTRQPDLRYQRAPLRKGILAFNVLASFAYAGVAFARAGPPERDTRGIAIGANVPEPLVGGLIVTPAVLDAARYFHPRSKALRWASRGAKVAGILLVLTRASPAPAQTSSSR